MNSNGKQGKPPFKPFIMGAALGALGGMLGMYLHQSSQPGQQAARTTAVAPADCIPAEQQSAEPTVRPSKDPEDYEFYGVLEKVPVTPARPDLEQPQVPPPVESALSSTTAVATARPLYLQVASFKAAADADALKARIVMAGEPASVVAMDIPEKGTHYRVRVGPFTDKEALSRAKTQLAEGGIDLGSAFVVR